jgi:hypothetical protein
MIPREKSSVSAPRRWSSKIVRIFSQVPSACQSRRRRQQVMPQPQPISRGKSSQGIPVLRTKRMPVKALRSSSLGCPPLGLGVHLGRIGSIIAQSSSGKRGFAMVQVSGVIHP